MLRRSGLTRPPHPLPPAHRRHHQVVFDNLLQDSFIHRVDRRTKLSTFIRQAISMPPIACLRVRFNALEGSVRFDLYKLDQRLNKFRIGISATAVWHRFTGNMLIWKIKQFLKIVLISLF